MDEEAKLAPRPIPKPTRHFLDVFRSSRLGSSFTVFSQREPLLFIQQRSMIDYEDEDEDD